MKALLLSLTIAAAALPALAAQPEESGAAAAYDARVRAAFSAAEAFQGPLDGGWTLSGDEGALYALRFVDHAGRLEAVWRDLRRPGALGASGFVDTAERTGGRLSLRFSPAPGREEVVTLEASGAGWRGELVEDGRRRAVSLARSSP